MKRDILIGLIVCLVVSAKAQLKSIPKIDGKIELSEVVKLDSSFKTEDLFRNAEMYFVNNSSGVKDVIQYDDKVSGTVIAKSSFQLEANNDYKLGLVSISVVWNVNYNTEIIIKDNKYKYRFYNFIVKELYPDPVDHRLFIERNLKADDIEKTLQGPYKKTYLNIYSKMTNECFAQAAILKKEMVKQQVLSDSNF